MNWYFWVNLIQKRIILATFLRLRCKKTYGREELEAITKPKLSFNGQMNADFFMSLVFWNEKEIIIPYAHKNFNKPNTLILQFSNMRW